MSKGKFICLVILAFTVTYNSREALSANFKPINLHQDYKHDRFGTEPKDIVLKFRAYITSFDSNDDDNGDGNPEKWGVPHFVSYEIKRFEGTLSKGPKRPSSWITDKELKRVGLAPTDATYKYSRAFRKAHPNWYDRGHLCMKQHAWRLGSNADWNTHTVLNAVPQRHDFNSGIWLDLEKKTAAWADEYGSVWIIVGPIFNNKTPTQFLGEAAKNEMLIGIPDALFKIVIKESDVPPRPDVLAFIYPQEDTGHKKGPFNHIKFLRSIDDIEDLTGLDFLKILPEEDQDAIESSKATELWN